MLVDTSMSQRRVLNEERDASESFLAQVLREDQDKAFVIHFDREVELLQDLTSSHEQLRIGARVAADSAVHTHQRRRRKRRTPDQARDVVPAVMAAALFSMTRSTWRPTK